MIPVIVTIRVVTIQYIYLHYNKLITLDKSIPISEEQITFVKCGCNKTFVVLLLLRSLCLLHHNIFVRCLFICIEMTGLFLLLCGIIITQQI